MGDRPTEAACEGTQTGRSRLGWGAGGIPAHPLRGAAATRTTHERCVCVRVCVCARASCSGIECVPIYHRAGSQFRCSALRSGKRLPHGVPFAREHPRNPRSGAQPPIAGHSQFRNEALKVLCDRGLIRGTKLEKKTKLEFFAYLLLCWG